MKYLFLLYLIVKIICQDEEIYFALTHFRHGINSPLFLNKENKDIFGNEWKDGPGELTLNGVKQHYLIGLRNKNRYRHLLNYEYKSKEILVYSTNLNRTIMSAQAQLLGMYNQIHYDFQIIKGENKIPYDLSKITYNENFNYYPVPINTYEEKRINNKIKMIKVLDYVWPRKCKKNLDKINKNLNNETLIKSIVTKIIDNYFNESMKTKSLKQNYRNVNIFCEAIISNYYEKKTIEKFKDNLETVEKVCEEFEYLKRRDIEQNYYAKDSGTITMSLLIDNILYWMKYRIKYKTLNETAGYPKYVMYSGHDTTLIAMQRFLKDSLNIEFSYTPFASSQFFELRKNNDDKFFVEIYYDNTRVYREEFKNFEEKVKKVLHPQLNVISYCEGVSYDVKISIILLCLFIVLSALCSYLAYLFMQKLKKFNNSNQGVLAGNTI